MRDKNPNLKSKLPTVTQSLNDQGPRDYSKEPLVKLGNFLLWYNGISGKWKVINPPESDKYGLVRLAEVQANLATEFYKYCPSHGVPGYMVTSLVAERLGAEAILPPTPPGDPEAVY